MKRPRLPSNLGSRLKLPRPSGGGSPSVQAPPFVRDVYRDLRDRRLLPVVVLALAGLVAVPLLLSRSPEPAPPPALGPLPAGAEVASPAVLTDQPVGLRDYRKRLELLKSRNPFKQKFVAPPAEQTAVEVKTDDGASQSTSASGDGTGAEGESGSEDVNTQDSGSGDGGGSTEEQAETETRTVVETEVKTKTVEKLVAHRAVLRFGPLDSIEVLESVRPLTFLPDETAPVVVYVDANEAGEEALFVVASDVSAQAGDGVCAPEEATCRYLTLQVGDVHRFEYTPEGATEPVIYGLKLQDIRRAHL